MSGEIESCDLLVVGGTVYATLQNGREIQIGRSGRFSGLTEVEDADISGEFSGKLVVRRRLTVRAGGKIDGEIFYDEIEVEPGGEISGRLAVGDGHATEIETPGGGSVSPSRAEPRSDPLCMGGEEPGDGPSR